MDRYIPDISAKSAGLEVGVYVRVGSTNCRANRLEVENPGLLPFGLTARATRNRLPKLVERGPVREVGTSPQDPRRRYFRVG